MAPGCPSFVRRVRQTSAFPGCAPWHRDYCQRSISRWVVQGYRPSPQRQTQHFGTRLRNRIREKPGSVQAGRSAANGAPGLPRRRESWQRRPPPPRKRPRVPIRRSLPARAARPTEFSNCSIGVSQPRRELMKITGWQAHSVRGFLSGTIGKKMGLIVTSTKSEDGERSYSIKP